jgi:hypothetical protein
MEKIQGYEDVQAMTGEFETLNVGGYICQILNAKIEKSSTGKDMLVIAFDIVEGEKAGFYKRKYDEAVKTNTDPNKKVSWPGRYIQMLQGDNMPNVLAFLKGVMTSLEASNPGFKWDWNEEKLKGLKFGGLFGREEFEKLDGTRAFTTKIRWIRTVEKVRKGEFEIPTDKKLKEKAPAEFTPVTDDDLPF